MTQVFEQGFDISFEGVTKKKECRQNMFYIFNLFYMITLHLGLIISLFEKSIFSFKLLSIIKKFNQKYTILFSLDILATSFSYGKEWQLSIVPYCHKKYIDDYTRNLSDPMTFCYHFVKSYRLAYDVAQIQKKSISNKLLLFLRSSA